MITNGGRPGARAQGPDVARSPLHLIGRTPLLELARIREPGCARILVKLEYVDPPGPPNRRVVPGIGGAFVSHSLDELASPFDVAATARTTAREILAQAGPAMAAFVAAADSRGTLRSVAERFSRDARGTRIVAVVPELPVCIADDEPALAESERSERTCPSDLFPRELMDDVLTVSHDEAMAMAQRLALDEAIFAGFRAGANVAAALRVARDFAAHRAVVTLVPDHGLRYLWPPTSGDRQQTPRTDLH